MIRQYELVEKVRAYDPQADEDLLNRAYVYAMKMHGSQRRESGALYFSHPLEVAGLLTQMRLDTASIVTALLHDVVEDTDATLADIEKMFGAEIARLVDGVTKLSRLELQSDHTKQAENFQKLVVAMSEDIRVLLVKLADRLHNMRTLCYVANPARRRRTAIETMEIYAPLAERIGMQEWKDELEDLAFAEINAEARESITKRLEFLRREGQDVVGRIIDELSQTMRDAGLNATVSGREKRPRSIWQKMQRKDVAFEQLADIMAFRVIVDTIEHCYTALGIIHAAYRVVPGRFKDYISTPKPNGYRSLHTGVIGPESQRIEIQIRTREMHEVAEIGVAAHWRYKQGGDPRTDGRQYRWLRDFLDILEHAAGPEDFLEHTKLEMFQDQVFCFTPKGDLIALPQAATPVDFAYAVHSEIGDHCASAKINGRLVPLRSQLRNGDQVEIITSRAKSPSPEWERFVVSGKAKARIRRIVRQQQRGQYIDLGRAILQRTLRAEGLEPSERTLEPALKALGVKTVEDLYAALGEGTHTGRDVMQAIQPAPAPQPANDKIVPISRARSERRGKEQPILLRGLIPGMALHFARCCHPLPGDRIVGIVTTGKGVTVHTAECETLVSFAHTPERWLEVDWDERAADADGALTGRVHLIVANAPGNLGSLSTMIAQNHGNITNLKFTNRSRDFFEMLVDIEVGDVKHLTNIIAALRTHPSISSVERARG
ncbi:guanosine-3',5'-bis(diphosphate) 3'-pyrophosphohydrolase [Constrictibacter sp. MBR-5]|jgi:GTP pyrophosphokinase|uniref:RelA/SpoT family protein n=1 Tax=Constrictibacter sp. MBR-5 TaxID=3156467 RepID=UPI003392F11B